jgi:pantothenate kinase-related protein Tda10
MPMSVYRWLHPGLKGENVLEIFDDELLTPEEQQELATYMNEKLAQIEDLLYRMKRLALLAAREETPNEERLRLQKEIHTIEKEINALADQMPELLLPPQS